MLRSDRLLHDLLSSFSLFSVFRWKGSHVGGSACVTPIASCSIQASASVCTTCNTGFVAVNNGATCLTKIADCSQQSSASVCTACESGKVLVTSRAQCVAPIQNCKIQTSETVCSECATEHKHSNDLKNCVRQSSNSNSISALFGLTFGLFLVLF